MHGRRVVMVGFGVVAWLGIAGCGDSSTTVAPPPTRSPTTTVAPAPPTSPVTTASTPQTAAAPFAMPNLVGHNLQAARLELQHVAGNPHYVAASRDATGHGRLQTVDQRWKVCSQSVAAGTRVPVTTHITLDVVQLTETCP